MTAITNVISTSIGEVTESTYKENISMKTPVVNSSLFLVIILEDAEKNKELQKDEV